MTSFHMTVQSQEIVFETGALEKLSALVEERGWKRLFLCTTSHLRQNGHMNKVEDLLGEYLVAAYDEVEPHVPDHQLAVALARAEEADIDAVIGLGGGSPIGMAKAVSHELETKLGNPKPGEISLPTQQARIPCIAIPTTYAGSEMTPVYGVTRIQKDGSALKETVRDARVTPRLVLYDPELTLNLPETLTSTTGINALAHCIEAIYSRTRNPISTSLALRGIHYIWHSLLQCATDAKDIQARTRMMIGAHLAGAALASVEMGLHHGICHVLGGTAGVPHGAANSIVLPHAMRFNADVLSGELALVAEALGLGTNNASEQDLALQASDAVFDLIAKLNVPQQLRDVGVKESLLPNLAEIIIKNNTVRNNPKPLKGKKEALDLLRAAW